MKTTSLRDKSNFQIIPLFENDFLEKQRIAGQTVAEVMKSLILADRQETTATLLELSRYAESEITKRGCSPTFKNYKGFPEAVCICVNQELVHGVPIDKKLENGDLVTFDFGATYQEAIADSATTIVFGEIKTQEHFKLLETTKLCLARAINSIRVGDRLGVIGNTIFKTARENGFSVISEYGGHGIVIDENGAGHPHAPPFVSNKSDINDGVRFQNGMTIAIEPLLIPQKSSIETKVNSKDGWTVSCQDICAHEEHTIFIHDDRVEVITSRD